MKEHSPNVLWRSAERISLLGLAHVQLAQSEIAKRNMASVIQ